MEIEELNAEDGRLLQAIDLQNSGIVSEFPLAVRKTSNSDPLADPQPVSAWCRGQYPLHRSSPLCQQADKRRAKDKERQIRDKELLERWPRVDGEAELQLLYEDAIPRALYCLYNWDLN